MGRPKKFNSSVMVEITVDFYENVAHGDISQMKYTKISEHAKSCGYDIDEQHFRRDSMVRAKIEELKTEDEKTKNSILIAGYKNLDVNEILMRSKSIDELKRNIMGLDKYWRAVYEKFSSLSRENKYLRNRSTFEKEAQALEGKNLFLTEEIEEKDREIEKLKKEITYLKSMLRSYLYPSLAEKILQDEGLLKAVPSKVKAEAMDELIEDQRPAAYEGKPHARPERAGRMEKLLNELEGMADKA